MSRNERKIRAAAARLGIEVKTLLWEQPSRGFEMCGPNGGWLLNSFYPIGYTTEQAIENLADFAPVKAGLE